jgi:nucleotide-binding universal stress UspA family protein
MANDLSGAHRLRSIWQIPPHRRPQMQILFATDGSIESRAAAQLLNELPLRKEDAITLLTVCPSGNFEGVLTPPYPEAAAAVLADAREAFRHSPVALRTEARQGHVAEEILRAVAELRAELLVVGACGLSPVRRFLVGSVAERVVRHSSCPTLLVRPHSGAPRRALLGIDASPGATRAAEWLRQFPLPAACELRLVTVLPLLEAWLHAPLMLAPPLVEDVTTLGEREREAAQSRLRGLAASLGSGGRRVETEIRSGDPALLLLQVAEEEGVDLIVVGSHGQSATERFFLGSVSEKVLRHAHCSVLIVR